MGIYNPDDTLKDADLEVKNPFQWMQQNLLPAMKAAGFSTKEQQLEFLERVFNRNAAETGALLGVNPGNVERTAASIKRSDSLNDATTKIDANDPYASLSKAFASLKDLGAALAGPSIPGIVTGLNGFAAALGFATSAVTSTHKNPDGSPEMLASAKDSTWAWLKSQSGLDKADAATLPSAKDSTWAWLKSQSGLDKADAATLPSNAAGRNFLGRDPRSPGPQSGSAYTPPSAPVVNANVTAPLTGVATVNVTNHVDVTGLVSTIMSSVKGQIEGIFRGLGSSGTNSDSGFDGRASVAYPDHVHGSH
jgi:hypothetical protein